MQTSDSPIVESRWLCRPGSLRDRPSAPGRAWWQFDALGYWRHTCRSLQSAGPEVHALVTFALIGFSTLLRWVAGPLLPIPIPFTFYLIAIVAATVLCGPRWGCASVFLSLFLALYVWTPPAMSLRFAKLADAVDVLVWALVALFIVAMLAALQRATLRQTNLAAQLSSRSADLADKAAALENSETKLRQYSEQLEALVAQRTEQLTDTIAELESFSYSISHNLRSPLRAIQGFAQLALEDSAGQITDRSRDYLNRIDTAVRRMDQLVQDLAMFNRAGEFDLAIEKIELRGLLDDMVRQHPHWLASGGFLQVEVPDSTIEGNRTALTQALAEIVDNAFKFVAHRTVPAVRLQAEHDGEWVHLRVTDNGVGIPPDFVARLFEPFSRGSDRGFPGRGMGLAVARKILVRCGGRVAVESSVPGCTIIKVDLPLRYTV